MSHPPATPKSDRAAWKQAVLQRQVERLEQLSEAGLRLALAVEGGAAEAVAGGRPAPGDAAMAFSRVARAVRMTALLQSRLIEDMDRIGERDADLGAEAAEEEARSAPAYRHMARVEAIVERVARAHTDDQTRIDRLVIEAGERLEDDDIYGEVLARPVGELVALVCRDLGLDPDWGRLSQEAWAQAEIAAAPPGSPFLARAAEDEQFQHQDHQDPKRQAAPFHVRQ